MKATTSKKKLSEDALVRRLMRFRLARDRSQTELMCALMWAEENYTDKIKDEWCYGSFDAFIKAHDFCRPDVYRSYVRGFEAVADPKVSDVIGYYGTVVAANVPTAGRPKYLAMLFERAKANRKQPSNGSARAAAVECGMKVKTRALGCATELDKLREENQALKEEIRKRDQTIARLRMRLSDMRRAAA